ncbi:ligase-associated DNA damage response endonuclease PdeM [Poseidonocella sedimentorum]|uniref:Putative phosphoesterase n=1 Tax=Poseidonocella sedimentorum TaxID=871652 RepID=A0A1I6EA47_9RHOB|nr:ligase-associated DNA damage response endonuclease PdeM [Poseidonocella sedimentorum]SFR14368.1 putative phosphoesterase [Poseidonocella sedimentorum]
MTGYRFSLNSAGLIARPAGTLLWPDERLLVISDLHFGKSERMGRRGGALLPPYEVSDTLDRLEAEIASTAPQTVVCLGDSFDDLDAGHNLEESPRLRLTQLQAGRRWIWIEGNHDAGPIDIGGTHLAQITLGPLTFRHIAEAEAQGEISGHYHPKARAATRRGLGARPAFLIDVQRVIMPAFGTYTGGLAAGSAALRGLMSPTAKALLTGAPQVALPLSHCAPR